MYWEEERDAMPAVVPDDITDLGFRIECRSLPVDHAWALSQAVQRALPWFGGEERAGLHPIHGAESGNGWYRPDARSGDLLYLSRRTRFVLRLPEHRLGDARVLTGQTFDIGGHVLKLGPAAVKPLQGHATLFSRYVVSAADEPEESFLGRVAAELQGMGVRCKKMVCGRAHTIGTPAGEVYTRSLMLADLGLEDSIELQRRGLGPKRVLGCGLFIPHKGLKRPRED